MVSMTVREFRLLLRKLRTNFPIECPIVVVRRPGKCNLGLTTFNGRQFRIRISSNQPHQVQFDTLLHEWAHALAIAESYAHGERWGILLANIYDAWARDFNETSID